MFLVDVCFGILNCFMIEFDCKNNVVLKILCNIKWIIVVEYMFNVYWINIKFIWFIVEFINWCL